MNASMLPSSAPKRMRANGFSDPAFQRVADLAHLTAGLVFPPNRQPAAEAGMLRAMAALHLSSAASLFSAVERPGDARDTLLAELTVGESYFFRDESQLGILGAEILARAQGGLRVWSAGCASGEEPYTVAILLRELGWTAPATILATDIALPRLAAARRARYTRWALRGASDVRINRWFTREGSHLLLDPTIRQSVRFDSLNLTHDEYPSAATATQDQDLILCRNVMIYFDLPTVARIAERLMASLAPEGWLVLGASDPFLPQLIQCEAVTTQWGIAYRRLDHPGTRSRCVVHIESPTWEPVVTVPATLDVAPAAETLRAEVAKEPVILVRSAGDVLQSYAVADYARTEILANAFLADRAPDPDALPVWIAFVRAVANQGRLHEAGELCTRALELHPMSAELQYLHATLLVEAGWLSDATAAARRAIYIDRTFVMGHLLLGDTLSRSGEIAAAQRALDNALALLSQADAASPVLASDGVPAARLKQIATMRRQQLAVVPA